jgi:hypothetical protein
VTTMSKVKTADKTIFTLRDSGDYSVGIAPATLTLSYDWEIDPDEFNEILHRLHDLNDQGWHGSITAYVEYVIIRRNLKVKELMRRINDYAPEGEPELEVSFF